MMRLSLLLHLVLLLGAVCASPAPAPGRVPKVYNALITSNQNLEPSKAYPVYQPVLHDPFGFSYSPFVYGDYPISNGLIPVPAPSPKGQPAPTPPAPSSETPPKPAEAPTEDKTPSSEIPPPEPQPESDSNKPTSAPPLPPNTESPIPLNEFGLPSQVLPLGRINPAYNGFTQVGPFTYPYTYSGFRFYDPYDPFSFNPYANLPPLYRPLANTLISQGPALVPARAVPAAPAPAPAQSADAPPSEPSDLNLLNYASKDPTIPNVPPPPLPSGGLKTDKSE